MHIYRRHKRSCKHRHQRLSRKCDCRLWVKGILEGKPYERTLKTRSIQHAEKLLNDLKKHGAQPEPEPTKQPKSVTVETATAAFISDCENRKLSVRTLSKYRTLATRLQDFCSVRGLSTLNLFSDSEALNFRASWKGASITLAKSLEFARVMFGFFHDRAWIEKNWFKAIKPPKVKDAPRLSFSEEQIQAILAKAKDDRELCFLLVLRHTGLRIGDASLLRVSQVSGDRVFVNTAKTGNPVSVKVPPNLESLLKALPQKGGYFFLRGESTHPHSTSDSWRKRIKAICKDLDIKPDHPHRFRHTLAADLLSRGVSVENVAAILGNSPAIVAKVYAQWVKSRQDALDAAIESTWKPTLKLVKKK